MKLIIAVLQALSFLFYAQGVHAQENYPGWIEGDFQADRNGGASYRVPIAIPPGINNLEPKIDILYHGNPVAGALGLGFELTGISNISRCPASKEVDGYFDPVDFDDNDQYCLGGDRLIRTNDVGENGERTYLPQIENYDRVFSYENSASNSPTSFVLKKKNGTKVYFGDSASSRKTHYFGTMTWMVTKIEDRYGNYISYDYGYDATNEELFIEQINYTGNDNYGLSPQNKIVFEYQTISQAVEKYQIGMPTTQTRYLKRINTFARGEQIFQYQLDYNASSSLRSLQLESISQCSAGGVQCARPLSFTWRSQPSAVSPFGAEQIVASNEFMWDINDSFRGTVDIDLNGYPDLYGINGNGASVAYGSASGFAASQRISGVFRDGTILTPNNTRMEMTDLNRDGLPDILFFNKGNILASFGSGDSFSAATVFCREFREAKWYEAGVLINITDLNKDGYVDVVGVDQTGIYAAYGNGTSCQTRTRLSGNLFGVSNWDIENYPTYLLDINADNYIDVVSFSETRFVAMLGGREGFTVVNYATNQATPFRQGYVAGQSYLRWSELNGDSLPDLVITDAYSVKVLINTGYFGNQPINGSLPPLFKNAGIWTSQFGYRLGWSASDTQNPIYFTDVNKDGLDDLLAFSSNSVFVAYNTGSSFESRVNVGSFLTQSAGWNRSNNLVIPTDVNGDATLDFIGFRNSIETIHGTFKSPKVTKISYGFNNTIDLEYEFLQNSDVYQNNLIGNTSYPVVPYTGSTEVLSKVTIGIEDSLTKSVSYRYHDFALNVSKHGGLGFRQRSIKDELTGLRTVETYSQDYSKNQQGTLLEKVVYDRDGLLISKANFIYETKYLDENQQRFVLNLLESKTIKNDDNGQLLLTTTVSNKTRDSENNITRQEQLISGEGLSKTVITESSFVSNHDLWILGKPASTTVSTKIGDRPEISRTTRWVYDDSLNLVETISDPGTKFELISQNELNSLGLPIAMTVKWSSSGQGLAFDQTRSTLTYDQYGFLTGQTNSLGHRVEVRSEPAFGNTVWYKSANNQETNVDYDRFGNQIKTAYPDNSVYEIERKICTSSACPVGASFYKIYTSNVGSPAWDYFDSIGRKIQSKSTGFDGQLVVDEVRYNQYGLIDKMSLPYYENEPVYWTQRFYDDQQRLVRQLNPDGSEDKVNYTRLQRTIVNAKNQTKKVFYNILGETEIIEDNLSSRTSYNYDSASRKIAITKPLGSVLTFEYDLIGRKIKSYDENFGSIQTEFNHLNLPYKTSLENGSSLVTSYDKLGRRIKVVRASPGKDNHEALWEYDKASYGVGAVSQAKLADNSFIEKYSYDALSRPNSVITEIDGKIFNLEYGYDNLGRPETLTYPTGFSTRKRYNSHGYVYSVLDQQNNSNLLTIEEINALGNITQSSFGNGVRNNYGFDPRTGRVESIDAISSMGVPVQSFGFEFDKLGNLVNRVNRVTGESENFYYDALNRLETYDVFDINTQSIAVVYDSEGNIKSKSDVGSYNYSQTCNGIRPGPNAVSSIQGKKSYSFCYDNLGRLIEGAGRTFEYSHFLKPTRVEKGSNSASFEYGPFENRFKRIDNVNGLETTTYIIAGVYEYVEESGKKKHRHYIGDFAVYSEEDGTKSLNYLHSDHLGSITTISDSTGTIEQSFAYDPWGKKRDSESLADFGLNAITSRGFTQHEQLDSLGLIHMNGRVYDPELGRFTAPDPVTVFSSLQELNRYSYVANNPLSFVDPTGLFKIGGSLGKIWDDNVKGAVNTVNDIAKGKIDKVAKAGLRTLTTGNNKNLTKHYDKAGKWVKNNERTIVTVAVTAVAVAAVGPGAFGIVGANLTGGSLIAAKMAIGFGAGYYQSRGDLKTAVISGLTAGVLHGVGVAFTPPEGASMAMSDIAGKIVAHGVVGGARSVAMGGNFEDGFRSAALTEAIFVSGAQNALGSGVEGQFVMAAVIGGTTSELTGGTFEEGAIYGGMQYSFNHLTTMQKTQLRVNSTAAGVAGGAVVGAASGAVCTAGAVVCSPAGAIAGGAAGGVVGAAVAEIIIFIDSAVDSVSSWFSEGAKTDTLEPGPYAGESVPASKGPSRAFPESERAEIDRIGRETGCHTCGSKNPGNQKRFTPDHQPPNALNPDGAPQRLYPHCQGCSRRQGGQINRLRWKK